MILSIKILNLTIKTNKKSIYSIQVNGFFVNYRDDPKSTGSANVFAILRSVIDTTLKSGQNVLNALFLIATFGAE